MRSTLFLLLVALMGLSSSCQNIDGVIATASTGEPEDRREGLEELHHWVRGMYRGQGDVAGDREALNRFCLEQFDRETDPVNRAKLIDLSLQAELPGASTLVQRGARDRNSLLVRQAAVLGMAEAPPEDIRELLTEVLTKDDDLLVRIEAAKLFGVVGSGDWVEPLIDIAIDSTEDHSLRFQAHRSAQKLTGETFPFSPREWENWREKKKSTP